MDEYVLDASAVIALIRRERGWEAVEAIKRRLISTVNLAEVGSFFMNEGYTFAELEIVLAALKARVVPFDRELAMEAARLRPLTKARGLSLGDRACLAVARLRGIPAMTGDRKWRMIDLGVTVTIFR